MFLLFIAGAHRGHCVLTNNNQKKTIYVIFPNSWVKYVGSLCWVIPVIYWIISHLIFSEHVTFFATVPIIN